MPFPSVPRLTWTQFCEVFLARKVTLVFISLRQRIINVSETYWKILPSEYCKDDFSSTTLKRMQYLCSTTHKGMYLPPYLSSLFSGHVIRSAHSFDGDGLLKVKPTDVATNPSISSWPSKSFTHFQVSSSVSSISQHLESRESPAGTKHAYEVMGKKWERSASYCPGHCLVKELRRCKFRMLFKATMLVAMSVRLARRVPVQRASRSSHSSRGYSPMLIRYQVRGPDPGTERLLS